VGIYDLKVPSYKDIRFLLEGNSYYEVIGGQASILMLNHQQDISTGEGQIIEYLSQNNQEFGIVKMINEVVSLNSIVQPANSANYWI